jgi:hypothetical protein
MTGWHRVVGRQRTPDRGRLPPSVPPVGAAPACDGDPDQEFSARFPMPPAMTERRHHVPFGINLVRRMIVGRYLGQGTVFDPR